ncbi:hypothetical protein QBC34DRAFT_381303 [Podospora aff. communis PSN243]|uniref:Uncharacterized protein n=1 Tax=Podospora aff. communis PSN243 TaxID=3040156 RepID=A0AAV9GKE5_9PEZI|nr:hypothetical protein QBC34DRAFT_381303 [Podospora aff. communis PSN243]
MTSTTSTSRKRERSSSTVDNEIDTELHLLPTERRSAPPKKAVQFSNHTSRSQQVITISSDGAQGDGHNSSSSPRTADTPSTVCGNRDFEPHEYEMHGLVSSRDSATGNDAVVTETEERKANVPIVNLVDIDEHNGDVSTSTESPIPAVYEVPEVVEVTEDVVESIEIEPIEIAADNNGGVPDDSNASMTGTPTLNHAASVGMRRASSKQSDEPIKGDIFIDAVVLNSEVLLEAENAIVHTVKRVFEIMMPKHPELDRAEIMNLATISGNLHQIYETLGAVDEDDQDFAQWIKRHKAIYRREGADQICLREGAFDFLKSMQLHGMPVLVLAADPENASRTFKRLGLTKLIDGVFPNALLEVLDGHITFSSMHQDFVVGKHSYRFSPVIPMVKPSPIPGDLGEVLWVACTPYSFLWANRSGLQTCWLKVTNPNIDDSKAKFKVESISELGRLILDNNKPFTGLDPDDLISTTDEPDCTMT